MSSPQIPAPAAEPLGRRIPPPVWRIVNRIMRTVLRLPFPTPLSKRLMLVDLTGRKTGRRYRQPVSYVQYRDTLLTPGGGNWKRNLQPGQPVQLRINGHNQTATPEIITDPDHAADLLSVMIAANPTITRFSGIGLDADGRANRQQLDQAIQHGFTIICWHPDPPQP